MWTVLRRRDFALVWTGGLISLLGDWVLLIGLPLYVYDRTGSTLATGGMFLVRFLPQVVLGTVAAVFVDRWDRRRTLVAGNLLLAAALVPVLASVWTGLLALMYAGALLAAMIEQFAGPAEDALIPRLVEADDLVPANALNTLNNNLARLAGPPLGALLYEWNGVGAVAIADALSFLLAAALIGVVAVDARPHVETGHELSSEDALWLRTWRDWLAGMRLVRQQRAVAVLILFAALIGLGEGTLTTLFVPFIREVLRAGDAAYGALLSAQAAGGILGGVVVGRLGARLSATTLWGGGALGLALFDALIFASPHFGQGVAPALVLFVVVGVPIAGLNVGSATVRQAAVAD